MLAWFCIDSQRILCAELIVNSSFYGRMEILGEKVTS